MNPRRAGFHERWADGLRDIALRAAACQGSIAVRAFLVGCPRSGTTLLQSLLHAHRHVTSLPETHFLPMLLGCEEHRRSRACRKRGVGARLARLRRGLLADIGLVDPARAARTWRHLGTLGLHAPAPVRRPWRLDAQVAAFAAGMDAHALGMDKRVWLEKTPDHLFYAGRLSRLLPDARFIHLQRDGRQVVASLYQAAREHEAWHPYLDLERGVDRWAAAVRESARWQDDPRHLHVHYEDLVDSPEETLRRVLAFLGCEPDPALWSRYRRLAGALILDDEPWKRVNLQPLQRRDGFAQVLDGGQRHQVEAALARLDLPELANARQRAHPRVPVPACVGIAAPHA